MEHNCLLQHVCDFGVFPCSDPMLMCPRSEYMPMTNDKGKLMDIMGKDSWVEGSPRPETLLCNCLRHMLILLSICFAGISLVYFVEDTYVNGTDGTKILKNESPTEEKSSSQTTKTQTNAGAVVSVSLLSCLAAGALAIFL